MDHLTERARPLHGMRILIVDDEFLIAAALEDMFDECGAEIITASTVEAALDGAAGQILSAAVLDVRLGRRTTESVADLLADKGIPFVFYSGQALPDVMRDKYGDIAVLNKPMKQAAFLEAFVRAVGR